jgi:ribonuclease P protein component
MGMGGAGNPTGAIPALPPGAQQFPKAMRLLRRSEFLAVQETGKKFHGRHFLAVVAFRTSPAEDPLPGRVGITTSKKVGKAVARNRVKRLVREYLRRHAWVPPGTDVVIIARRSAGELRDCDEIAADLDRIGRWLASC